MKYSGELIELNGHVVPCIISYKIIRNKLWGADTGRNMAGKMKGTLVGLFPKILLEIAFTTDDDMSLLENILDSASITVKYYNNKYKKVMIGEFYSNDYEEVLAMKNDMIYRPFSVNLIPNESEDYHVPSTE